MCLAFPSSLSRSEAIEEGGGRNALKGEHVTRHLDFLLSPPNFSVQHSARTSTRHILVKMTSKSHRHTRTRTRTCTQMFLSSLRVCAHCNTGGEGVACGDSWRWWGLNHRRENTPTPTERGSKHLAYPVTHTHTHTRKRARQRRCLVTQQRRTRTITSKTAVVERRH